MFLLTDKSPRNSLVGERFGRLMVIAVAGYTLPPCGKAEWYYVCNCDCGTTKTISAQNLRKGDARSCRCLAREEASVRSKTHGMSHKPTYGSWASMWQRCSNEKHKAFENYGGNGVQVCDHWSDFSNFLADMGVRPAGTSLDRIDGTKGYEKSNCRWATPAEQSANRRNSIRVLYHGREMCFAHAVRAAGLDITVAKQRRWRGWPVERIIPGATPL